MKKTTLSLAFITFCFMSCGPSSRLHGTTGDYAKEIQGGLAILGWDIKDFYFRGSPVGNYGIGTMYLKEKNTSDARIIESTWLLSDPDIWFEETVPDSVKNAILKRIIMNGEYGSFSTSDSTVVSTSSKIGLLLFNLLSLDAGLDLQTGVKASISASSAVLRKIAWPEFEQAIIDNKMSKTLTKVYNANNYVIAAMDIVLKDYKVKIEINKTLNPNLNAKLTSAVGKVIGSDSSSSLTLKRVGDNKFEVTASHDVVAALLFKDPPPEADRGPGILANWKTVQLNSQDFDRIEKYVSTAKK